MNFEECIPFAPSLIESMRSLGYSFPAAIADLIDNSISADASSIDIISEPSANPEIIIMDNGCGMSQSKLYEAMRYGSQNPLKKRSKNDLGRFGLGLKSASLSQCRRLVVVAKQDNNISAYSWDLDCVISEGKWIIQGYTEKEIEELPHIKQLFALEHGTYILLKEFDRIKEGTKDIEETFNKYMDDMVEHISLVFHRFITEDNLIIRVNNRIVEAKDPFLTYHPATQKKRNKILYVDGEPISMKPFILPHISKMKSKDLEYVGGKDKLRTEQGFYVYRNRRLIIWGTWFRLERKDELNKLARVRIDIPNTLDYMWSIDIKKSSATLPDRIKKNMYSEVYDAIALSEKVHTHRGRKINHNDDITYVWDRIEDREGCRYVINRNIPQLELLNKTLDDKQLEMVERVLTTLEKTFPSAALYVDMAKGTVNEKSNTNNSEIDEILTDLLEEIQYVKSNNLDVKHYCKALMKVEPYCNYDAIKERIKEIMEENE